MTHTERTDSSSRYSSCSLKLASLCVNRHMASQQTQTTDIPAIPAHPCVLGLYIIIRIISRHTSVIFVLLPLVGLPRCQRLSSLLSLSVVGAESDPAAEILYTNGMVLYVLYICIHASGGVSHPNATACSWENLAPVTNLEPCTYRAIIGGERSKNIERKKGRSCMQLCTQIAGVPAPVGGRILSEEGRHARGAPSPLPVSQGGIERRPISLVLFSLN